MQEEVRDTKGLLLLVTLFFPFLGQLLFSNCSPLGHQLRQELIKYLNSIKNILTIQPKMSASFPMDRICGCGSRAPLLQPPYFANKGSGDLPKFILPAEGRRLLTWVPQSGVSCSLQPISGQKEEACLKPAHIRNLWKPSHSFSQHCWHFCDSERLKTAET